MLDQIRDVEIANGGRGFVTPPCSVDVRAALIELALFLGVPANIAALTSDADLTVMYSASRNDPGRGRAVGQKIARKYATHNPLLDDTPAPEAPYVPSPTGPSLDEIKAMIAPAIGDALDARAALTASMIEQAVEQALLAREPTSLVVTLGEGAPVPMGVSHYMTADIIATMAAGVNIYLHGPAGSGKTTVGRKLSEAFKLPFYFAAKVESEYMLIGFKDARGETVRTQFREAYEHGGVFLFDELDASSPAAVVAMNAALANGICPFPDGIIARHPDFRCIAAGNTKLTGGDRKYVGRAQLDAASIDRFVFIEFGYDNALELALATNKDWARHVQAVRAAVAERGLPHLVTPRATIDGCKLLASGFDWHKVEGMCIWKGLDADTVDQIKRAMPRQQEAA